MTEIKVTCGICPGTFEMKGPDSDFVDAAALIKEWRAGHTHETTPEDRKANLQDEVMQNLGKAWEELREAFKP